MEKKKYINPLLSYRSVDTEQMLVLSLTNDRVASSTRDVLVKEERQDMGSYNVWSDDWNK